MGFGPRVARDQANNAFDLRRVVTGAGFDAALAEPIEPQNSIEVHHDLNDGGISQRAGNRPPHRRTEHRAPTTRGPHVPDPKSTRLNSSHQSASRIPYSALKQTTITSILPDRKPNT